MAKILISNVKDATHDGSQIEGLIDAEVNIGTVEKTFASDGEPATYDPVDVTVTGSANFENISAYNQALGGSESNLVANCRNKGGATTRVVTVKNVRFIGTRIALPSLQARQGGQFRCEFRANPGTSDTAATMVTEAAGV